MEINNSSKGISLLTTDVISGKLKVIHFDNINAKNDEGYTYLHIACINMLSPIELVTSLLKNGADPNVKDKNGLTPLHYASVNKKSSTDIVKLLLSYNADPNIGDKYELTPLHYMSAFSDDSLPIKTAKYLLRNGANPNAKDDDGLTPLHYVLRLLNNCSYQLGIIKLLLNNGADPNAKNKVGVTPLQYVPSNIDIKDIELLRDYRVIYNEVSYITSIFNNIWKILDNW